MGHQHNHHTCCAPVEQKLFGVQKDLVYALLSGGFLLIGFLIEKLTAWPMAIFLVLYAGNYFFGGYYTVLESWGTLKSKKFDIDFLVLIAAIGAATLGKFAEGGLLLFLFSLGHALEHYALNRASKSIAALSELTPNTALLKTAEGKLVETPIEDLKINDIVVAKPGSKIAADGLVVLGSSSVNQAPITGESIPVDKHPVSGSISDSFDKVPAEHKVFAGTINGNEPLEIQVARPSEDSTFSRLIELVKHAETEKAPAQVFADKFAAFFVPAVLILVGLMLFAFLVIDEAFKDSFYRAMAVLIAASPCALAISTPSAVLAGIARAARGGVLIKGGLPLQEMATIDAMAFDKTGTLTSGAPKLTHIVPYKNHSEQELLSKAVAVERLIDHPLARAIVQDGMKRLNGQNLPVAKGLKSLTARGVCAQVNGHALYIGNRRLMEDLTKEQLPEILEQKLNALEEQGHTAMIVREEQEFMGIIAVQDTARSEAEESIKILKAKTGIKKVVMLTGDNQRVANAIAQEVGIQEALGDLLPEDKVDAIKKLKETNQIAMVGDGVNDAPAMANSNVGISMGAAGSDVALETSNVALLGNSIRHLPFAILLAQKTAQVIKQNLFISIGVMALLVPLTISGLSIGPAVVIHEGSTLLVVANALRLLGYKDKV